MSRQGKQGRIWLGIAGVILFVGAVALGYHLVKPVQSQTKSAEHTTKQKTKQKEQKFSSASSDKDRSVKGSSSSSSKAATKQAANKQQPIEGTRFTSSQQKRISQAFLKWAGQRAEIGNMAVSDWYFDHGTAGQGDWYANTPDGPVQVQNFGHPGPKAFNIHALGVCVFYTDQAGRTGVQDLYPGSFAENYTANVNPQYPVVKYLLGDNGIVYELRIDNGGRASTNSGFGEYDDQGQVGSQLPDASFKVSDDHAAQVELKELIKQVR
ncbi:hypothetical protein [Weissella halotolerans]|uniref:Lipoprotein n=1 Tax=Weissella halotolerans DSM 20190 TaxID=1123500 RepID=A0A0R2G5F6_9LACO|nr:hypothetical protein [Weissella halotolerans]KRN32476.1 lipoprotein precursor [Weissella halotolerans DSM 20190]